MRAGRGLLLALAAVGMGGCEDSAGQPEAAATPAQAMPVPHPRGQSSASPSPAVRKEPTLAQEQAEREFAEKVRAVALFIGDDDGKQQAILPDDVFTPLINAGLVGKTFDGDYDYLAWSRPRNPFRMLGHDVALVLAQDIRGPWIGCCVERGVTVYLVKSGDNAALKQFANETRCRLEPASENLYLDSLKSARQPLEDADNLVALSCHERDIFDDRPR